MPPCCWPEWPRSPGSEATSDQRGLSGLVDDVGWWSNTDTVLEPFIATDKPWPGREPLFSVSGRRNRDRASLRGQSWSDSAHTHTQKLGGVIQLVGWTGSFWVVTSGGNFLLVTCMQVWRSWALPSGGQNSKLSDYIKFLQKLRKSNFRGSIERVYAVLQRQIPTHLQNQSSAIWWSAAMYGAVPRAVAVHIKSKGPRFFEAGLVVVALTEHIPLACFFFSSYYEQSATNEQQQQCGQHVEITTKNHMKYHKYRDYTRN